MIPLQDTVRSRNVPVVTWIIILINSVVFMYELSLTEPELQTLMTMLGMVPLRLQYDPEGYWTLITCMFLHGGWIHFIGNMWTLYLFGDNVEDRMGPIRFLIFYLLCGIAAGLAHYINYSNSAIPTVGASGAIAGVLAAYMILFPTAKIITLVPIIIIPLIIEIPSIVFVGVWFATQLFNGTLALGSTDAFESVAWWAHIGGFVAGVVLLPVFKKSREEHRKEYDDEYWPW